VCACAGKIAKSKAAARTAAALEHDLENAAAQCDAAASGMAPVAAAVSEFQSPASGIAVPVVHVRVPLSPNTIKHNQLPVELARPLCMWVQGAEQGHFVCM